MRRLSEVAWFEDLSNGRRVDQRPDVSRTGEGHVDAEMVEEPHLGGFGLQVECFRVFRGGTYREGEFTPDAEGCLGGQQLENFFKLQDTNCVLVHRPPA